MLTRFSSVSLSPLWLSSSERADSLFRPGVTLPSTDDTRSQHQSVLLYVQQPRSGPTDANEDPEESLFLTETTIANVLFLPARLGGEPPAADARWLTPRLAADTPFLPGLQRAALLAQGEVKECDISLGQAKRWVRAGGRVACANALRGVWDVQVDWQ